jgi:hypothetical protein
LAEREPAVALLVNNAPNHGPRLVTAGVPTEGIPRSAFYEGWISHRRSSPVAHSFRYRILIPLLDLGELPGLLALHPV